MLSLLFAWRLTQASEPFLPLPVLANPVMRMGTMCTSFSQGVVVGLTIFLPLYYEVVHKFSASNSGLALIPIVVMSTPGSIVAGRAMMYFDHYKRVPVIGLCVFDRGALDPGLESGNAADRVAVVLSVVAFGIGTTYPVGTVSIQNAVSRYQVGAAMGGDELLPRTDGGVHRGGDGRDPAGRARRGARTRRTRHVVSATAANALGIDLAHVFRGVFALGVVCLIVSLIALIRMEERPLRGPSEEIPPPA